MSPVFSLRAVVVLTFAALAAAIVCGLTLAAGATWPAALLSAGAAGAGVLELLPRLIDDDEPAPVDRWGAGRSSNKSPARRGRRGWRSH